MQSFQSQYTQCQNLAQDNSADALVFFKSNLNIGQHILENELGSFYTEEVHTDLTEDGVFSYPTPDLFVRLKAAYITIDNIQYNMEQVFNEDRWRILQARKGTMENDILTHIFVRRDRFEVYPTPATAGYTMTFIYEASGKDLSFADHTTGTITTLANAGTVITGDSTAWTTAMEGRYIKIGSYPIWYKIIDVDSATSIDIDKPYTGLAIAAGSETYTIGEMPRTPGTTHHIPVYFAMMQYYLGFKQNAEKGAYYKSLYEADLKRAKVTYGKRYSSNYIPGRNSRVENINPNDYPTNITY